MLEFVKQLYADPKVVYLLLLIVANLVLGILASLRSGDFRLIKMADWLWNRAVPLLVGYGVAAAIGLANPDFGLIRDAAWTTLTLALVGYVLANLRDLGVPLPEQLAGK